VDTHGNIFILDARNGRIRKVDASTGVITTVAGGGLGDDGDLATRASLSIFFGGVALDSAGNIFIADSGNHRIRKVDAVTGIISTVAGTGIPGSTGPGGPATSASLQEPQGLAVDVTGNLLVADTSNNRMLKVSGVAASMLTVTSTSDNGDADTTNGEATGQATVTVVAPQTPTPTPTATLQPTTPILVVLEPTPKAIPEASPTPQPSPTPTATPAPVGGGGCTARIGAGEKVDASWMLLALTLLGLTLTSLRGWSWRRRS